MAKASRRIKLSKNLRPFVSRVVRDGKAQRLFAQRAQACGAHKGMSKHEITAVGKCIGQKYPRKYD